MAGVETKVVGREYLRVAASGDAAVRLATLYAPTSTTRAALHTRQREAEASGFLKFLEDKAEKAGAEVLKKLKELVEEGEVRGMSRLVGLGEEGVKILEAGAELRDDRPYAIIRALVDGVDVYKIRFFRGKRGARYLQFYMRGDDAAARAVKLVKVITGEEPRVTPMSDGRIKISGTGRHIDALARYEELREALERWSSSRAHASRSTG